VYGYALPAATNPNNCAVSQVRELLAGHVEGDVRDAAALQTAVEAARPDVIFHLAAQALVRESYAAPRETFEVNAMGTANLLEAVRKLGRPCIVVIVTSDKCYENREQVWGYREEDAMGGHDPYSASKGVAEVITASYRRSFFNPAKIAGHGVKLASARAGNVIGGGDWSPDRIVVDAVTHLSRSEPVPVRNPAAIRPWQHVLEPLGGYLQLAAALTSAHEPSVLAWLCSAWNFGPRAGDEATVKELVTRFCAAWDATGGAAAGGGASWKDVSDPAAPHEAGILRLSIDKATWLLGWKPRWNLEQTVARTAGWYRAYYDAPSRSMRAACLADLDAYMAAGQQTSHA
jgi:CDP-glucose 4,6-dehydratase